MPIGLRKDKLDKKSAEKDTDEVDDLGTLDTKDGGNNEPLSNKKQPNKMIVVAAGVAAVLGGILIISNIGNSKSNNVDSVTSTDESNISSVESNADTTDKNTDTNDAVNTSDSSSSDLDSGNGVYDENGKTLDPNGINPGEHVYGDKQDDQTTATVYSADDYIKDLNGLDVSAVYRESDISYVIDYVSYEAHRAIIDQGMELYWLEAEYCGRKYRVQCPFYYFKTLGASGICKVEVEVVNTSDGGKIITYMQVVPDDYERND